MKLAETSDLDAAVPLFVAQLREHNIVTPARNLREVARAIINDSSLGFLLLAVTADLPVGFVYVGRHMSLEYGGTIGILDELYVNPENRGGGVGSCLLAATIERARVLQWRTLELEIVAGHERAASLYARHGFALLPRARYSRPLGE